MDCQAFDDAALDLLYDEGQAKGRQGDELRRHADACSRCAGVLASLRRGRELAELPTLPVPSELEARILAQVEAEPEVTSGSWLRTLDRWVSMMGSYAMRPQAAMGALAMLTVGMSLLLLRARPAGPGAVRITENGVPAADAPAARAAAPLPMASATPIFIEKKPAEAAPGRREEERPASPVAQAAKADTAGRGGEREAAVQAGASEPPSPKDQPASPPTATATATAAATAAAEPAASAAATAPPADAAYAAAMDDFKARRFSDAVRGFDIVANGGGGNAPMAALHAARATRYSAGCGAALPRYDAVASRYVGSSVAAEATWEAAGCYREVGQIERARQLYQAMRRVAGYRDRAEKEMNALDQRTEPSKASASKPSGPSKLGLAAAPASEQGPR